MRYLLPGVLLALSACFEVPVLAPQYGPPEPTEGIGEQYNAANHSTSHWVTLGVVPKPLREGDEGCWLEVRYSRPGRAPRSRPAKVWLVLEDRSEADWSERTRVVLVADGRRLPLRGLEYQARGTKVGSIQTLSADVSVSWVDRLARAHEAAVEIAGRPHPLDATQRALLREFVATP